MTAAGDTPVLRVAIVDDEEPARLLLREFLSRHAEITIVAECANGFEAVKAVTELRPDLVFLDVQMPKLDGFEVLELLGNDVPVVFVTAYDSYALRAFEVHAVDYLLKPFSESRLDAALDRARARLRAADPIAVKTLVADARTNRTPIERLLIRDRSDVHVVHTQRIDFIESQDDYVSIAAEGKRYLKEQTLGELEGLLDPGRFLRIHRRYILNVARLSRIEQTVTDSRVAILTDGTELPISKSGYARLKTLL